MSIYSVLDYVCVHHPHISCLYVRYGPLFKTSLAGRPVVVSTDADFNRFILLQEGKLVELWYLDAFAKIMGDDASTGDCIKTNATGFIHKHLRGLVSNHFGPERLRDNLLAQLHTIADETLISWMDKDCVDAKQGCTSVTSLFNHMLLALSTPTVVIYIKKYNHGLCYSMDACYDCQI